VVALAVTVERGFRVIWRPRAGAIVGGTVGNTEATGRAEHAAPQFQAAPAKLREIDPFTLEAAQRGDRRAFDAIVDLYADRLRLLAFHLLRDADLTDDALQDTFFNAFRGLPAFRRRSALGTWLYRITYTVCMGYLRRARARSVSYEESEDVLGTDPDPADRYSTRSQVAAALAALSPEQRVVVLLVDRDGFDYRSVAEVLDVPKGTVCSRLSAARAALRQALTSAHIVPETMPKAPSLPRPGETP
jgi:RNA polymerase sigma-70 factor (ECF subfamily)